MSTFAAPTGPARQTVWMLPTRERSLVIRWLAECQELRELFHELNRDDPSTGYGFEWYWRDLPRLLGGGPARAASAESFVDFVRSLSAGARRRIEETNGYHCLYSIRGDEVWRWVVSRAGIRRDVVPAPAGELRELLTSTVAMMAEDPGRQDAPPGAELRSNLRRLARALLPPEVFQQGEAPLRYNLLISADDFLGFLPFEAVDISNGEAYLPLLGRCGLVRGAARDYDGKGRSAPPLHLGGVLDQAGAPLVPRADIRFGASDLLGPPPFFQPDPWPFVSGEESNLSPA